MKKTYLLYSIVMIATILAGCSGGGKGKKNESAQATSSVADTGYTGIKQYMSNQLLIKEITFSNGVREGLMKAFYMGGQLYQTFWYEKGLKEDSARYYYLEGQLFRTTPYKHDTIDGIQKQFYRTGQLKAKIGFSKGMRTPFFQEYTTDGKLVTSYPSVLVAVQDEYKKNGTYKIILGVSEMNARVKFYRGAFTNDRFDTTMCKFIPPVKGKVTLTLQKSASNGSDNVGIVAAITTLFGNKYLTYKKIDLPYKDLN